MWQGLQDVAVVHLRSVPSSVLQRREDCALKGRPGIELDPSQPVSEPTDECGMAMQALAALRLSRRLSTAGDSLGGRSWGVSSLLARPSSGKSRFPRTNLHRRSHLPN